MVGGVKVLRVKAGCEQEFEGLFGQLIRVKDVALEPNGWRGEMAKQVKNTICLWYDGGAEEAARFYAATFPDSSVGAVHRAPADFPSGKKGDVLTVEFTVLGV